MRRKSIVRLVTLPALVLAAFLTGAYQAAPHVRLRVGLINPAATSTSSASASTARGVRLGAAEAKQTAKLFGDDVELYEASASGDAGAAGAAKKLSASRQIQVLIGASSDDADALSGFAESKKILFFNVASRASSLRAACRRYTFHLEAMGN